MSASPLRVTHVITGLETGGAETLLARLVERLGAGIECSVISLTTRGAQAAAIEALGIPVRALEMHSLPRPTELLRLRRAIAATDPDLLQSWLVQANVLTALLAPRGVPLVWGVHSTDFEAASFGRSVVAAHRLERALAGRVPARIIACSQSAFEAMATRGYPLDRLIAIPNGFDLARFHPDRDQGAAVRGELSIPPDAPLVGHFARYHPVKDHATFLAAAALVRERVPDARFVLCGTGVEPANPHLAELAAPLGSAALLLGERRDVDRLYRALDLLALSSAGGEALPLVVGEAMASAVPVVATRLGDPPAMIADTGRVVAIRDPTALAAALVELLELPAAERRALGAAARERIAERYSLETMVAAYVRVWEDVASRSAASRS